MKKLISLLIILCLAMAAVPALGEQAEIQWFMYDHFSDEAWQADPLVQYSEEASGITYHVITAPWGECDAKLNLLLANGELPDVYMSFWYPWTESFTYLQEDGEIVEITDMLDDYPNLKEYIFGEESFKQLFIYDEEGNPHIWGVPRYYTAVGNYNLAIRKDLLDKYGFEIPKTWDELHDALAVICPAEGIAGLLMPASGHLLNYDAPWTECNTYKQNEDGTWSYEIATDGYRDFLAYFAKWYEEGLLDPDFRLNQSGIHIEKMAAGKCVCAYEQWNPDFVSQYRVALEEQGAEIALIPYLKGPEGTNDFGGEGAAIKGGAGSWLGWQMINSRTGNAENVLKLYDWLLQDGGIFTRKGVEGVHYQLNEDGTTTWLDGYYEEIAREGSWNFKYDTTMPRFFIDYLNEEVGRLSPLCDNADIVNEGWQKVLDAQLVRTPYLYQFNSENNINYGSGITTTADEWRDAFLTGERDIDTEWDAYLEALDAAGYSKVIADINAWMEGR